METEIASCSIELISLALWSQTAKPRARTTEQEAATGTLSEHKVRRCGFALPE